MTVDMEKRPVDLNEDIKEDNGLLTPPWEPEEQTSYDILDLIYGVLFDPAQTFKKVAARPPLWQTVTIYALLNLLVGLMGIFINIRTMEYAIPGLMTPVIQGAMPFIAFGGFIWRFIKWFIYSALLHLIADFYSGKGNARGVFIVYGLATIPAAFIIPFQVLTLGANFDSMLFSLLFHLLSLIFYLWSVILLIVGIREVHQITTGKAVAVVFTPLMVIILIIIFAIISLMFLAASISHQVSWPPFF